MRILLYDSTLYYPSSPLFLEALVEVAKEWGYEYDVLDEGPFLQPLSRSLVHKIAYRILGRRPLSYWSLNQALLDKARSFRPSVVLVTKGAHISPDTLKCIKRETGAFLINYATDDPFNPVMSNTRQLIDGIPLYDLYACTKSAIMDDIRRAGCKNVAYVQFGYKPSVHFPEKPATPDEKTRFASDIVFIGTYDPDRNAYFETVIRALPDVRLHLYGAYWHRHPVLRRYHRGLAFGRAYRLALAGTRIAIFPVRRTNRDEHSMRTFEIPACGAFLLAEWTREHQNIFEEDKEVAFFGSPGEMVEKIRYYLLHDSTRGAIAEAGYRKVTGGGNTYKDRLLQILSLVQPGVRTQS